MCYEMIVVAIIAVKLPQFAFSVVDNEAQRVNKSNKSSLKFRFAVLELLAEIFQRLRKLIGIHSSQWQLKAAPPCCGRCFAHIYGETCQARIIP